MIGLKRPCILCTSPDISMSVTFVNIDLLNLTQSNTSTSLPPLSIPGSDSSVSLASSSVGGSKGDVVVSIVSLSSSLVSLMSEGTDIAQNEKNISVAPVPPPVISSEVISVQFFFEKWFDHCSTSVIHC
jgi:hypothetical protein